MQSIQCIFLKVRTLLLALSVIYYLQWERLPLEKGGMPMQYVTYDSLLQFGVFIVTLVGLVYQICHRDKK